MVSNSYGKSSVRLVKVRDIPSRGSSPSAVDFHSLSVTVLLKGDFASSYLLGDNERLVPIDTIANVVYKTAETVPVVPLETFAATVGKRFLALYEPIALAEVSIQEELYDHVALNHPTPGSSTSSSSAAGNGHPTSFTPRGSEKRVTTVKVHRSGKLETESGIADLHIIRTKSQFGGGFRKDEYTTQDPTTNQIIASTINIAYKYYDGEGTNFDAVYFSIRKAVLDRVCNQPTLCLQQLSLSIGRAVIEVADQVKEVEVVMPSQALQPAPLTGARSGGSATEVKDRLLVPSKEPFGVVRCVVKRHHVSIPSPFVWNPSFDVKDKVMNQQHSDLFDMISALDKDRKNTKLLQDILQHAKDHFEEEEKKLFDPASGLSRAKAEQHQQIHTRFVQQAVNATKGKPVTDETILFLKKWLVEHIMGPDMMWARAEEAKKRSASKL
jgi:urate oxidase